MGRLRHYAPHVCARYWKVNSNLYVMIKDDVLINKASHVKNPMTVIAIFAAIAEISGTTVLPFIEVQNQYTYIWFLILFPVLLVTVFFATLNFNRDALYAPSDYKDEKNFTFHRLKQNSTEETEITSYDEIKGILEGLKQEDDISLLKGKLDSFERKLESYQQIDNDLIIDLSIVDKGYIVTDYDKTKLFQELLNGLYFDFLIDSVPTFSYGKKWQLVETDTNRILAKRGSSDYRTLADLGISKDKIYRVELL